MLCWSLVTDEPDCCSSGLLSNAPLLIADQAMLAAGDRRVNVLLLCLTQHRWLVKGRPACSCQAKRCLTSMALHFLGASGLIWHCSCMRNAAAMAFQMGQYCSQHQSCPSAKAEHVSLTLHTTPQMSQPKHAAGQLPLPGQHADCTAGALVCHLTAHHWPMPAGDCCCCRTGSAPMSAATRALPQDHLIMNCCRGGGAAEVFHVQGEVDVHIGTLSKAFGSHGGFVAGSHALKDFLMNRGRSYVFSTSLPLPAVAAAHAALRECQQVGSAA